MCHMTTGVGRAGEIKCACYMYTDHIALAHQLVSDEGMLHAMTRMKRDDNTADRIRGATNAHTHTHTLARPRLAPMGSIRTQACMHRHGHPQYALYIDTAVYACTRTHPEFPPQRKHPRRHHASTTRCHTAASRSAMRAKLWNFIHLLLASARARARPAHVRRA